MTTMGEKTADEVSLALSGLVIEQGPGEDLFRLSSQLAQSTIEGTNRYVQDLPIVIGAVIDGSADAPVVH